MIGECSLRGNHLVATARTDPNGVAQCQAGHESTVGLPSLCHALANEGGTWPDVQVTPTGTELSSNSSEKRGFLEKGGAESGSLDDGSRAGGLSRSHGEGILKMRGVLPMRVYLDNCCFNRPFDDQSQARVRLEAEAKLEIQQRIKDKQIELAWSYVLDYEGQANPFEERRDVVARWKTVAMVDVEETAAIIQQAHEIAGRGLCAKDALHVACAVIARCDFFLTTDDLVVKRMRGFAGIVVMDPTQFIIEVE